MDHNKPNKKRKLDPTNVAPSVTKTVNPTPKASEKRLIVILEGANLQLFRNKKDPSILNADDHMGYIKKNKFNPSEYRPEITHECLLMLFDSLLNRAGLLQVYIHTRNKVLIEISPQTRVPRTLKRFKGLMVQLLKTYTIKNENDLALMKVVKNRVQDVIPTGCKKVWISSKAEKLIDPTELVPTTDDKPVVVVINATVAGTEVTPAYVKDAVKISNYPLSAVLACDKVVDSFEESWSV